MYYNRSRSPAPYSSGRSSSTFTRGLPYSTYSSDLPVSSLTPRNRSVQRVIDSDFGRSDRSRSPVRNYASPVTLPSSLRTLPSALSGDASPELRRRDTVMTSSPISDSRTSPVNWLSGGDYTLPIKPRSYYDFPSTSSTRYSSYSTTGIKRPQRTDYSDYFRPAMQNRPMLKSGYTPRPRSERENVAVPLVRERKLIKFREITNDILNKVKRKISWDLPEEIDSPLINEMRNREGSASEKSVNESVRSRDNSLTKYGSKEALPRESSLTRYGSKVGSRDSSLTRFSRRRDSDSPTPSVSRRSSDQSVERMSPRNLMHLKSPRIGNNFDTSDPGSSLSLGEQSRVVPVHRKKSVSPLPRGKKPRKSSIENLTSEEKRLNYSLIADKIRKSRESPENSNLLLESPSSIKMADVPTADASNINKNEADFSSRFEGDSIPDIVPDKLDRRNRRRCRDDIFDTSSEQEKLGDNTSRRNRVRPEQDFTPPAQILLTSSATSEGTRPIDRMHRKSVKYKTEKPSHHHHHHRSSKVSADADKGALESLEKGIKESLEKSTGNSNSIDIVSEIKLKKTYIDNVLDIKPKQNKIETDTVPEIELKQLKTEIGTGSKINNDEIPQFQLKGKVSSYTGHILKAKALGDTNLVDSKRQILSPPIAVVLSNASDTNDKKLVTGNSNLRDQLKVDSKTEKTNISGPTCENNRNQSVVSLEKNVKDSLEENKQGNAGNLISTNIVPKIKPKQKKTEIDNGSAINSESSQIQLKGKLSSNKGDPVNISKVKALTDTNLVDTKMQKTSPPTAISSNGSDTKDKRLSTVNANLRDELKRDSKTDITKTSGLVCADVKNQIDPKHTLDISDKSSSTSSNNIVDAISSVSKAKLEQLSKINSPITVVSSNVLDTKNKQLTKANLIDELKGNSKSDVNKTSLPICAEVKKQKVSKTDKPSPTSSTNTIAATSSVNNAKLEQLSKINSNLNKDMKEESKNYRTAVISGARCADAKKNLNAGDLVNISEGSGSTGLASDEGNADKQVNKLCPRLDVELKGNSKNNKTAQISGIVCTGVNKQQVESRQAPDKSLKQSNSCSTSETILIASSVSNTKINQVNKVDSSIGDDLVDSKNSKIGANSKKPIDSLLLKPNRCTPCIASDTAQGTNGANIGIAEASGVSSTKVKQGQFSKISSSLGDEFKIECKNDQTKISSKKSVDVKSQIDPRHAPDILTDKPFGTNDKLLAKTNTTPDVVKVNLSLNSDITTKKPIAESIEATKMALPSQKLNKESEEIVVVCKLPPPKKLSTVTKPCMTVDFIRPISIDQNLVVSIRKSTKLHVYERDPDEASKYKARAQQIISGKPTLPIQKSAPKSKIRNSKVTDIDSEIKNRVLSSVSEEPEINIVHTILLKPKTKKLNSLEENQQESLATGSGVRLKSIPDVIQSAVKTNAKILIPGENSNIRSDVTTINSVSEQSPILPNIKKEISVCNEDADVSSLKNFSSSNKTSDLIQKEAKIERILERDRTTSNEVNEKTIKNNLGEKTVKHVPELANEKRSIDSLNKPDILKVNTIAVRPTSKPPVTDKESLVSKDSSKLQTSETKLPHADNSGAKKENGDKIFSVSKSNDVNTYSKNTDLGKTSDLIKKDAKVERILERGRTTSNEVNEKTIKNNLGEKTVNHIPEMANEKRSIDSLNKPDILKVNKIAVKPTSKPPTDKESLVSKDSSKLQTSETKLPHADNSGAKKENGDKTFSVSKSNDVNTYSKNTDLGKNTSKHTDGSRPYKRAVTVPNVVAILPACAVTSINSEVSGSDENVSLSSSSIPETAMESKQAFSKKFKPLKIENADSGTKTVNCKDNDFKASDRKDKVPNVCVLESDKLGKPRGNKLIPGNNSSTPIKILDQSLSNIGPVPLSVKNNISKNTVEKIPASPDLIKNTVSNANATGKSFEEVELRSLEEKILENCDLKPEHPKLPLSRIGNKLSESKTESPSAKPVCCKVLTANARKSDHIEKRAEPEKNDLSISNQNNVAHDKKDAQDSKLNISLGNKLIKDKCEFSSENKYVPSKEIEKGVKSPTTKPSNSVNASTTIDTETPPKVPKPSRDKVSTSIEKPVILPVSPNSTLTELSDTPKVKNNVHVSTAKTVNLTNPIPSPSVTTNTIPNKQTNETTETNIPSNKKIPEIKQAVQRDINGNSDATPAIGGLDNSITSARKDTRETKPAVTSNDVKELATKPNEGTAKVKPDNVYVEVSKQSGTNSNDRSKIKELKECEKSTPNKPKQRVKPQNVIPPRQYGLCYRYVEPTRESSSSDDSELSDSESSSGSSMSSASETETPTEKRRLDEHARKNLLDNECNVTCHQKCEKLMPNLCGVNQKLLSEVLETVKKGKSSPEIKDTFRGRRRFKNDSVSSSISSETTTTTFSGNFDDSPNKSPDVSPNKRSDYTSNNLSSDTPKKLRFRKYGIDDFVFLKLLGKGSFGKVLLAELKDHDMYFAIKCLKKDVVLEDDDVESTMIERRVLTLGTQHPYMCKLYCTFQTNSYLFFVMEYLNGGDLMFHIQESRPFEVKRAMFYGAEIVSALKFLHKRGIIYRDIKLDNVMLDKDGHVRLVDFGMCQCRIYSEDCMPFNFCGTPTYIAPEVCSVHLSVTACALNCLKLLANTFVDIKLDNILFDLEGHVHLVDFGMCKPGMLQNTTSTFCGTPDYIPPEIILGKRYHQSVDWWSFGVLLFEMLAGRSPFVGTDEDELFWSICNEEPFYPRFLPKEAKHILENLLIKTPTERLGMPASPAGKIEDHPFFSTINWDMLEKKQIPPPFKPTVLSAYDTGNFDRSFTMDSPTLSPVDSDMLASMDQEQFQGFSYTNPHITG